MSSTGADRSSKLGHAQPQGVSRKTPVVTDRGTYYVRAMSLKDVLDLTRRQEAGAADAAALGKAVVQRRTTPSEGERDEALSDDEFAALTGADQQALAAEILRASAQPVPEDGDAVAALGQYLLDQRKKIADRAARPAGEVVQAFEAHRVPAVEAARSSVQRNLDGITAASDALQSAGKAIDEHVDAIRRLVQSMAQPPKPAPEPADPASPSPSRVADAAEAAVLQMKEVAGSVATLAAHVGQLSATVASQVVPSWMERMREDQKSITRSLWWAKAAVALSILVALWQGWMAREYRIDHGQQQQVIEALLKQQGEVTALLQRQAEEEARKREAQAGGRKAPVPKKEPPKDLSQRPL
jgi:hypothetical protein